MSADIMARRAEAGFEASIKGIRKLEAAAWNALKGRPGADASVVKSATLVDRMKSVDSSSQVAVNKA